MSRHVSVSPTLFHHNIHEFKERLRIVAPLAKEIHVDIMDGHFVPDMSLEPEAIPHLETYSNFWTAHLMVQKPQAYIKALLERGFKRIIIHRETVDDDELFLLAAHIHIAGAHVWIAKNPDTEIEEILRVEPILDGVLFMGITPGKEGQEFESQVAKHIARFTQLSDLPVGVDGGINPEIAYTLGKNGATTLYTGSYVLRAENREHAMQQIREELEKGNTFREQYQELQDHRIALDANTIRQHIITQVARAKSGHPGGALGMADVFAYLYAEELTHDKRHPRQHKRDYLYLSNGHICAVLYATLAHHGYFPEKELETFRTLGSKLQGHPHLGALPGVENSGGPLGQGISQAVGVATYLKREGKSNRVYCISGDGELNEGQTWEAALYAAKEGLDNYVHIIDRNNIQIDGDTDSVLSLEPLTKKFESFGYSVINVNAHHISCLRKAFNKARLTKGKPTCIIAHSTPGKGVSFMQHDYRWHGKAPNKEQAIQAREELQQERKYLEEMHRRD